MKKFILYTALLSCIIYGCKQSKKISQAGVYKLEKQMVSGGGKDTVYARAQVKIFTNHYFVYAGMAPDSSVGFGVGSYTLDTGSHITEHNIYSSASLDSNISFHLNTSRVDSTYTQIIPGIQTMRGIKYDETEVYRMLPAMDTTILDGVWKLDSTYTVKGKDTVKESEVQFKAFWGGHFMFVHRYPLDNNNKFFKNGFGYGNYSFKSDTISENDALTNHAALRNGHFAIKITFRNNNDEYSQVITNNKTGEKSVEIYKRLK